MSAQRWERVAELFDQLVSISPDRRESRLRDIQGEDPELAAELKSLLQSHEQMSGPLDSAPEMTTDDADSDSDTPGLRVGPYRLLHLIGEGGMGRVWLADRADGAFKRSVALKLPQITWVGRFNERMARERDILSGLEHPNIARFYDAGVDELGRPFMAMEYVEGLPIDVYCRERGVSLRERLHLVLEVAKAVSYAHSKLIVHRDLKPGNILVTTDGEVRLLDFGLAKLVETGEPREARVTQFAGRMLTPDYASPEQINGEAIGTSTDVYSLAVVAYELLTEVRLYSLKRRSAADVEQAIAEADPRRASDAALDPTRKRALHGDLDAILNMALKKDPADRYASVEAFADDLQRYLSGNAVRAGPDRRLYRLGKFVGRNRLPVGAAAAVIVAIVIGASVSLWQARQARLQAERADQVKRFALAIFDASSIEGGGNQKTTARDLLLQARRRVDRELAAQPTMSVEMLTTIGNAYSGLGEQDLALEALREAVARGDRMLGPRHLLSLGARSRLAATLALAGEIKQAEPLEEAALAGLRDSPRSDPEGLMTAWMVRGIIAFEHGRQDDGVRAMRTAVEVADTYLPSSDQLNRVNARISLVNALQGAEDPSAHEEAARTYQLARDVYGDQLAPMLLQARYFYADTMPADRAADGIRELEGTLAQMRQALGPQHFMISSALQSLGEKRAAIGDLRGAVEAMRAYREMEDALQGDVPSYARAFARLRLGAVLLQDGHPREAVAEMQSAPAMLQTALGPSEHYIVSSARARLAWALAEAGDSRGADSLLDTLKELETAGERDGNGKELPFVGRSLLCMGSTRRVQGRHEDAERLLRTSLAQFERTKTTADAETARLQLAYTWVDAGKGPTALPVLQQAWERMRARHPQDSPPQADLAVALGRAQLAAHDLDGAERSLRWADDFWQRYDPANRAGGVAAAHLARVRDTQSNAPAARELRRRAAALFKSDPRPGDEALL